MKYEAQYASSSAASSSPSRCVSDMPAQPEATTPGSKVRPRVDCLLRLSLSLSLSLSLPYNGWLCMCRLSPAMDVVWHLDLTLTKTSRVLRIVPCLASVLRTHAPSQASLTRPSKSAETQKGHILARAANHGAVAQINGRLQINPPGSDEADVSSRMGRQQHTCLKKKTNPLRPRLRGLEAASSELLQELPGNWQKPSRSSREALSQCLQLCVACLASLGKRAQAFNDDQNL